MRFTGEATFKLSDITLFPISQKEMTEEERLLVQKQAYYRAFGEPKSYMILYGLED